MTGDTDQQLRARALAGDIESALELGRRLIAVDAPAGHAWFRAAIRAGGLTVMHRVIDYLEEQPSRGSADLGVWKRRAAIAEFPRSDAPQIFIALSTFAPIDER